MSCHYHDQGGGGAGGGGSYRGIRYRCLKRGEREREKERRGERNQRFGVHFRAMELEGVDTPASIPPSRDN